MKLVELSKNEIGVGDTVALKELPRGKPRPRGKVISRTGNGIVFKSSDGQEHRCLTHEVMKEAVSPDQRKLYNALDYSIHNMVKLAIKGTIDCNPEYLRKYGNRLKAAALEGRAEFEKVWHKLAADHPDLLDFLGDELFSELHVSTYDEMMIALHHLKEAEREPGDYSTAPPPENDKEPAKPTEDDDEARPAITSSEDDGDQDLTQDDDTDVGSVAQKQGYVKSKKQMFAFGATRPVTLLTKNEKLGGLNLTLQYVINPKTGAWSLRACLQGQSNEDMVEFTTGEDPSSLVQNLKKKTKITPHQAVEFLHPPADKPVKKASPAVKSAPDLEPDNVKESLEEGGTITVKVNGQKVVDYHLADDDDIPGFDFVEILLEFLSGQNVEVTDADGKVHKYPNFGVGHVNRDYGYIELSDDLRINWAGEDGNMTISVPHLNDDKFNREILRSLRAGLDDEDEDNKGKTDVIIDVIKHLEKHVRPDVFKAIMKSAGHNESD
jgi:hypothetical protein